jgi:hypothetical protein
MENLYIKPTSISPEINFKKEGLIEIRGISTIENPDSFYKPVFEWISEYVKKPAEKTVINFDMEYYNTSSQMWIFKIMELLADLAKVKNEVQLNWFYTDEDMKELGEDLESLLHIEFNYIKKEE